MNRFRIQVLLRVSAVLADIFLLVFAFSTSKEVLFTFSVIVLIFLIMELIRYVEQTNREVTRFLASITHADFTERFSPEKNHPFPKLAEAFENIVEKFRSVRIEKEEHYRYLQTVVEHVGIGVLCFNDQGRIELANSTLLKWFGVSFLKNLSDLDQKHPNISTRLVNLQQGDRIRIKFSDSVSDVSELSVQATTFKIRGENMTLLSFNNIKSDLDEKEMEAWQSLTRVLTHEIMNSITPISTLSATLNTLVQSQPKSGAEHHIPEEVWSDISAALETIHKRSDGLISFVNDYRAFSKLRRPDAVRVEIEPFLRGIEKLFQSQCEAAHVQLSLEIKTGITHLSCDQKLIEQVLINLLKNALDALRDVENGAIQLVAESDERGKVAISVSDNGPGITPQAMEKIFIPFFTTKQGGSGIGLSLSRQIMRLHGGTLTAYSEQEKRTTFTLKFPV